MKWRRFSININCITCANKISKIFKKYPHIEYVINELEQMINVNADEQEYSDQFIIDLIKKAGYIALRID